MTGVAAAAAAWPDSAWLHKLQLLVSVADIRVCWLGVLHRWCCLLLLLDEQNGTQAVNVLAMQGRRAAAAAGGADRAVAAAGTWWWDGSWRSAAHVAAAARLAGDSRPQHWVLCRQALHSEKKMQVAWQGRLQVLQQSKACKAAKLLITSMVTVAPGPKASGSRSVGSETYTYCTSSSPAAEQHKECMM